MQVECLITAGRVANNEANFTATTTVPSIKYDIACNAPPNVEGAGAEGPAAYIKYTFEATYREDSEVAAPGIMSPDFKFSDYVLEDCATVTSIYVYELKLPSE